MVTEKTVKTQSSRARRSSIATRTTSAQRRTSQSQIRKPLASSSSLNEVRAKNSRQKEDKAKKIASKSTFESPEADKENLNEKSVPDSPRVTPYWEVTRDGRLSSPRLTRSATKKKKSFRENIEDIVDSKDCIISSGDDQFDSSSIGDGVCLSFSPPDHKKNLEREKKELKKKEIERSKRIKSARESGQFLIFSPTTDPKRKTKKIDTDEAKKVSRKSSLGTPFSLHTQKRSRCTNNDDEFTTSSPTKKRKQTVDVNRMVQTEQSGHDMQTYIDKLNKMEETNANLIADIQKMGQIRKLEQSHKAEAEKMRSSIEKLQTELSICSKDKNDLEAKLNLIVKEKSINDKRHQSEIVKVNESIEKLQSDLARSEEQKRILELKCKQDVGKKENSKETIHKMKTLIENNIQKLEEAVLEKKSLINQITLRKGEYKAKENELRMQQNERDQLQSHLTTLEDRLKDARAENETLSTQLVDMKNKQKDILKYKDVAEDLEAKLKKMEADNKTTEVQLSDLASSLTQATKRYKEEKEECRNLSEQLKEQNILREKEQKLLTSLQGDLQKAEDYILKLQRILKGKETDVRNALAERDSAVSHVVKFDKREDELNRRLRVMDEVRRDLHNKVMRLSGNMKVFVRVRPELEGELEALRCSVENSPSIKSPYKKISEKVLASIEESPFHFPGVYDRNLNFLSSNNSSSQDLSKSVVEVIEPYKDRGGLTCRRQKWSFGFDGVFPPSRNQMDMWIGCEPMIQSAIDGYNVCLFAYGQTGSGKTYTMLGDSSSVENQGIIFRAVNRLFQAKDHLEISTRGASKVNIQIEMLEIYNDKIRDLLDPSSGKKNGAVELNFKVTSNEALDNIIAEAYTAEDVLEYLSFAQKRRCVKATKSNSESSRSHLLFTIHFVVENEKDPMMNRNSKLHICDLAGSERLGKSGSTGGSLLKEAQYINSSLSALSNVIESLQSKKPHIPFRDSKLTYLLQDSLGGESKTLAIVCCSPLSSHFHESICSLRFAEKMNRVELKTKQIITQK